MKYKYCYMPSKREKILKFLEKNNDILTMSDVARKLKITQPEASLILGDLEAEGLLYFKILNFAKIPVLAGQKISISEAVE